MNTDISVLLFDLGQVILTNDWQFECPEKDREFESVYGITNAAFLAARRPIQERALTGHMSETNYIRTALEVAGAKTTDPLPFASMMRKYQKEIPGMMDLVLRLRHLGYRTVAVTDTHRELLEWKRERFGLNEIFEHIFTSFETGYLKEDGRIFPIVCTVLKVQPQACLLIDDSQEKIVSARNLGVDGIRFTGREALVVELRKKGITV